MSKPMVISDNSPGGKYISAVADALAADAFDGGVDPGFLKLVMNGLCMQVALDIINGEVVTLPLVGEFIRVDNHGAMIRYQADVKLLERAQQAIFEELKAATDQSLDQARRTLERTTRSAAQYRAGEVPIEDWPIDEDHRFNRSNAHAT